MKKTLLLIVLIIIALSSFGQNKTGFGIKGGLNYSNYINSNSQAIPADYNGIVGYYIGLFFAFEVSKKVAIRPELLYSKQGSNFSINGSDINIIDPEDNFVSSLEGDIRESMVLLPIILEYDILEKFTIEAGPQLGYSFDRKVEFKDNPIGKGFIQNDDSEKFELEVNLELGYAIAENYGASLLYKYGFIERQNLKSSVL